MNQAQNIIPRLRRLADLEAAQRQVKKDGAVGASLTAEIESVRAVLPTAILSHHDGRRARSKVSVAPVTRGICGACHLAIPRGRLAELRRLSGEVNVCDNCGVFIYLADDDESVAANTPKTAAKKITARLEKRAPRRTKASHSKALSVR